MPEQIKIATWNLCLGLLQKIDYVKTCLKLHSIDVLNLQETELKPDIPIQTLHIPGYTIELENNQIKRRIATYMDGSRGVCS